VTILVPITLYGWIFVAIGLFAVVQPRRAVLAAFLLAWLFLPQAGIDLPGIPDLDKITCTGMGAMIGVVLFDAGRLMRFRPSWVDLPMVVWCLSNIPSSLTNDLGIYDGLSGVLKDVFTWGFPYFIGRLYFSNLQSLRELALGIFVGGLIYVPLCLYELKMAPSLHKMVYGFHPSSFLMTMRYGGYRPMVFMQHGLMVGMWMCCTALVGVWLWSTGAVKRFMNVPMWLLVLGLLTTAIMCKSTGAIIIMALGLLVLYLNKYVRSPVLLLVLISLTPLYMLVRAEGIWSGKEMIDIAQMFGPDRADSIAGRLENEDILIAKASEKQLFGWGSWGRWRVFDYKTGKDVTVSDGMWVISRGEKGMVGLVSVTAILLLPFVLLLRRVPARFWAHPMAAAPVSLAMLLVLYSVDNLFNAMINPIFMLAAGGLSGFYVAFPQQQAMARRAHAAMLHQQQEQQLQQRLHPAPPSNRPIQGMVP